MRLKTFLALHALCGDKSLGIRLGYFFVVGQGSAAKREPLSTCGVFDIAEACMERAKGTGVSSFCGVRGR